MLGWNWQPKEQLPIALSVLRSSWGERITSELRDEGAFTMRVRAYLPAHPACSRPCRYAHARSTARPTGRRSRAGVCGRAVEIR